MNWFGDSWGARVCDPGRHVDTPVGSNCVECDVPINNGDQGFASDVYSTYEHIAFHRVCFLRTVIPCEQWTAEMLENLPEHWRVHRNEKHGELA